MTRLFAAAVWLMLASGLHGDEPPASSADESAQHRQLDSRFLLGEEVLRQPVDTAAFRPVPDQAPIDRFEGTLSLEIRPGAGRFRILTDWFGYAAKPSLHVGELPPFRFSFVQDGSDVIPLLRGPQASTHPHWEYILEPGKAWNETRDGGWTRVALPFSLQERNANCTHNGLLTFLFRATGEVSRVAYQVGSETCQYLQLDLWGVLPASYEPGKVAAARQVIEAYRSEVAARLPRRPLQALLAKFPQAELSNFDWYPADEVSTFGFAIDGVHYSGGCATRYGPYPFCDILDLPSYSLAKSIFAGTVYMMLEQSNPGIATLAVADFVPQCASDPRWTGVTLGHLVDMATGNFESLEMDVDEFASYETPFISGETHALKIATACTLFPRRAAPGTTFAYHTSDTYIAGTLLNAWLRRDYGPQADIHRDVLVAGLMQPLGLSPVTATTRRSYDETAQPFTGYGLTLHADDIVRLGLFLGRGDGRISDRTVLSPAELAAALQRNARDTGIRAGAEDLRYNNGFWALRTDLLGACSEPLWLPFMSGYGGISVVLMPNNSLFYVFSDKGRFEWLRAAVESNKLIKMCHK